MDPVENPYNPGAGTRPPALVGREGEIDAMDVTLQRLLRGTNGQSQLLTGLRGVGKTVLLNEFEESAVAHGYFHEHIEVSEDGALAPAIAAALRRVLLSMDAKRRIGDAVQRALGVLKAFTLRIPNGPELSIDVDAVHGPADSGDLGADLAGLFVELGQVAKAHQTGILLTMDELHYVDLSTFTALIVGLHRASQLSLPITVAGAGLPTLAALTGEAKTYAERMFTFPRIGSLTEAQATEALQVPATDEGVQWTDEAVSRVLEVTQCFPYFLQEFGKRAWDAADGPDRITGDDVVRSIPVAMAGLDDGFFRVRTGSTTRSERAYLRAMAELGPGPVRSAEVAAVLQKSPSAVSTVRDGLIRRALVYSPSWGEIAYTVPLFDRYMKRWMPARPT
jgi:AAA ATPase domain